jgi:hypothetical protein
MLSSKLSQYYRIKGQHHIFAKNIEFKNEGKLEGVYYNLTTNISNIGIWLIMPKLQNQNTPHRKLKPKQKCKTKIAIDQMLCSLFPHLKTNDVELALGCVNVFGGLQSFCSFVLVNLQRNFGLLCSPCTKCSNWSHGMITISIADEDHA